MGILERIDAKIAMLESEIKRLESLPSTLPTLHKALNDHKKLRKQVEDLTPDMRKLLENNV